MPPADAKNPKLEPITEVGGGSVQEKRKGWLSEIIKKVNDLLEGDLTDRDKLACQKRYQGHTAGVGNAEAAGGQQHQRAVRQLAGPQDRTDERHYRSV
jgi:hypothetical protein